MKFNLSLPYNSVPVKDSEEILSDDMITDRYIGYAISSFYPDGLEGQLRRIYGRIQRKMQVALDGEDKAIDLERAELDFILKAVRETKFPVNASRYVVVLEDELERLSKEE